MLPELDIETSCKTLENVNFLISPWVIQLKNLTDSLSLNFAKSPKCESEKEQ